MNIGMLSYPGLAGCGIVAVELGHELADRGHEVHFFASDPPFRLDPERVNVFSHIVEPAHFDLFQFPDTVFPLASRVAEVIRIHELDVVHAHYAVPYGVIAQMARQVSGRSPGIVLTLHGTDVTMLGRDPRYREILRHAVEDADLVTAVSRPLANEAAPLLGGADEIQLVPNFPPSRCTDQGPARPRSTLDLGADDFVLLHMSNLRPLKRIGDILEAVSRSQTSPKLIVLAGGETRECEARARALGVTDSLRIVKGVPHVESYIRMADAGVYASESEQCSLAMLETMAGGRPVIATNAGGTPDLIEGCGLQFDVGDVDTMAAHIDTLASNRIACREMGIAARSRAETVFSPQKIVDRYLELYARVTSSVQGSERVG